MSNGFDRDDEHLHLLELFHYVNAGITAFYSCFGLIYAGLGLLFLVLPGFADKRNPPPEFMGWLFLAMGAFVVVFGWGYAACMALAGRFLKRRCHRTFCLVVAGFSCLILPYGTVLGVCTIIVLIRPAVRARFSALQPPPLPPVGA